MSSSYTGDSSPMANLVAVQSRLDSLSRFLSNSIRLNAPMNNQSIDEFASNEISDAVSQIIHSGKEILKSAIAPSLHATTELRSTEIMELDAGELLAQRVHACEICGKGFKRDANLRMHMRAHGDRFKTNEALAGPPVGSERRAVWFSCPSPGCNRNKAHRKFEPLRSAVLARNHFKRSHCPRTYSCDRCQNRSFALLADLRSHLKTCLLAAPRLLHRCSCGSGFSSKERLFSHVASLEGHAPEEEGDMICGEEEEEVEEDDQIFEELLNGFASADEPFSLQDVLGR